MVLSVNYKKETVQAANIKITNNTVWAKCQNDPLSK